MVMGGRCSGKFNCGSRQHHIEDDDSSICRQENHYWKNMIDDPLIFEYCAVCGKTFLSRIECTCPKDNSCSRRTTMISIRQKVGRRLSRFKQKPCPIHSTHKSSSRVGITANASALLRKSREKLHASSPDVSSPKKKAKTVQVMEPCIHGTPRRLYFHGAYVIENFVSEKEEAELLHNINHFHWRTATGKKRKQTWVPKHRTGHIGSGTETDIFPGLPMWTKDICTKLKSTTCGVLSDFTPVGLQIYEFESSRGSHEDPHVINRIKWGSRVATVSLCAGAVVTFTRAGLPDVFVQVQLPRGSLLVLSGAARYLWEQAVQPHHVMGKRWIRLAFMEPSDCSDMRLLKFFAASFNQSIMVKSIPRRGSTDIFTPREMKERKEEEDEIQKNFEN